MYRLFSLLAIVLVVNALPTSNNDVKTAFEQFKKDYGKTYSSDEEEQHRLAIFEDSLKFINEHNKKFQTKMASHQCGITKFADWSLEEYQKFVGELKAPRVNGSGSTFLSSSVKAILPDEVDWRKLGYVTPVKDQAQCGSCWSFSATGSLEGQHFKKTGRLISLSEQNLVDCSWSEGNQGCNGGWPEDAFNYVKKSGIDTEDSYPYEAVDGRCRYQSLYNAAQVTGYVEITHFDEDELLEAVATVGPVSVAIDASHRSFQYYKSDIYVEPDCSTTRLSHAVLVVGYGETIDGQKYWLVKNSWSEDWGDKGYIKMARGHNNTCGIASHASYPLV